MPRRALLILMPFLLVPLILLLILGSITFFRRDERETATQSNEVLVQPVMTSVARSTPAPLIGTPQPAPPVPASLYRDRSPAVVSIHILGAPGTGGQLQLPQLTPEQGPSSPPGGGLQGQDFGFQAEGSGFLIDGQGHIVTNNHVVENAKDIEVSFTDGSTVESKVVGTDLDSDLAVIKVERIPDGVKPLRLGDSKQVKVGQRAIAIGNPFGLQSTLTVGVISGQGRTLEGRSTGQGGNFSLADVLQTDASINPGNSGGPLFNSTGEVIGVNQSIIPTDNGTFEGVGFAISSNTVKKVAAALITKGHYEHPYLGISMASAPITDAVAKLLKLPTRHGVPVEEVVKGGPSDKAGIRGGTSHKQILGGSYPTGGDIVLKIDDKPVNSSADVIDYLATDTEVGQTVTLTILRDGKEVKIPVVLAARP
jgi:S1-C subfamily serine protease